MLNMYVLENRKCKTSILIRNLYSRRLWHQLTQVLLKLVQRPELGPKLKEIYENAISEFETRLNPLSLVQIITPVVGAMEDKVWSREIIFPSIVFWKTCQSAFRIFLKEWS